MLLSACGDAIGYFHGRWELSGLTGAAIHEEAKRFGGVLALKVQFLLTHLQN